MLLLGLLVALLAVLLAKDIGSAARSAEMWAYPFQFDESEGMIVAETMLLDRGVPIYNKPTADLFIAAPYPPLYYLLNLPGQHIAGTEPTFKVGRALSILAALLVGVSIFGIVMSITGDKLAGALGAAAWWSLGLVTFWGSLVKPDMLAVALGLGGLWWLISRPSQVWWALPFFWGAFYTKQTAIAAAVAAVAWLLVTRPRLGLFFGAAYGAGALLPTLLLNLATGGGYLYHQSTLHDLPWRGDRFLDIVGDFISTHGLLLIPGVAALLVSGFIALRGRWKAPEDKVRRSGPLLLLFYLLMAILVSVGAGTLGGNHNHLLEWAAAGCLGVGLGAAWGQRVRVWVGKLALAAAVVAVLALSPSLFSTPGWLREEFSPLLADNREGMMHIFQYVTNNGGPAYSDNVGLLLATGKRLWTTDPYTQTHATRYGRWDESELLEAFKRKTFSQVILRIDIAQEDSGAGDVSPDILRVLRDNYKLDQRNVENIYVPRP